MKLRKFILKLYVVFYLFIGDVVSEVWYSLVDFCLIYLMYEI